jgi:hypothetical protein
MKSGFSTCCDGWDGILRYRNSIGNVLHTAIGGNAFRRVLIFEGPRITFEEAATLEQFIRTYRVAYVTVGRCERLRPWLYRPRRYRFYRQKVDQVRVGESHRYLSRLLGSLRIRNRKNLKRILRHERSSQEKRDKILKLPSRTNGTLDYALGTPLNRSVCKSCLGCLLVEKDPLIGIVASRGSALNSLPIWTANR